MKSGIRLIVCGMALLGLTGCAVALVGAGVAGGYAISRDSISNRFDFPLSHVYQVSRSVIGDLGLVTMEDERRGVIRSTVEGANVTITLRRISEKTVELKVRARDRWLMPKINVAQNVYNRIIQRL